MTFLVRKNNMKKNDSLEDLIKFCEQLQSEPPQLMQPQSLSRPSDKGVYSAIATRSSK
jgi:hypothetical protein